MSHVAVTGASGFVGRHLVRELIHDGVQVTAVVRATSDTSKLVGARIVNAAIAPSIDGELANAFAGCDTVFHLAGAVDFGADWARFREVNVGGTANVLAAARAAGVRRVVHCSSIVAVGAARRVERLNERSKWNLGGLRVPYVSTKREAEELALAENGRGMEVVVANPAAVIGPGDDGGSEFGTICDRFWRGKVPIHFGGGNNFVDVRDVVRGLLLCAERGTPGERYILGGDNRSMTAFFSELARVADRPIPRLRLPTALAPITAKLEARIGKRKRRRAYLSAAQAKLLPYFFYFDSGKAHRELGWHARPIQESLSDAYRDFAAGYK